MDTKSIAVTGIAFMILLVIQFGWIRKSIDISRRHFADRMIVVTNNIRDAFQQDKALQNKYLTGSFGRYDLFAGDVSMQRLEGIIKQKLDSVLEAYNMPLSTSLTGRLDSSCYLMYYVPPALRSQKIDHSPYKVCLCSNQYKGSLDIGFDLFSNNMLIRDTSGLILPSVMLILLLIALFAYIINVVNRQKRLAELKNDFINNLTHEFNTPLFSIGLTSSLLARSEPVQQSDKLKGYIELITTEKNRLQTQVDKILRLTAVESASLIMEKVDVDIHEYHPAEYPAFLRVVTERGGRDRVRGRRGPARPAAAGRRCVRRALAARCTSAAQLWTAEPMAARAGRPDGTARPPAWLADLRLEATLVARVRAEIALGLHDADGPEPCARSAQEHPLREDVWALLVTALYRSGRTADALVAYRTARQHLVRDLGLEPGPRPARARAGHPRPAPPHLSAPRAPLRLRTRGCSPAPVGSHPRRPAATGRDHWGRRPAGRTTRRRDSSWTGVQLAHPERGRPAARRPAGRRTS